jgi:hypothetical protein
LLSKADAPSDGPIVLAGADMDQSAGSRHAARVQLTFMHRRRYECMEAEVLGIELLLP